MAVLSREAIFEKLNDTFRFVFDDDSIEVNDSTVAADIDGWDSLMHITLIGEVESTFKIKFTMKEVIGMQNVGEMADIIAKKSAK